MHLHDYILILIFSLHIICTILSQFNSDTFNNIVSAIPVRVFPRWTFFAPKPNIRDYHLIFRDKDTLGNVSDWNEVHIVNQRTFLSAFWNPEKRVTKCFIDIVQLLKWNGNPEALPLLTLPYIWHLHMVMKMPMILDGAVARQFAVLTTEYTKQDNTLSALLVSRDHPFEGHSL